MDTKLNEKIVKVGNKWQVQSEKGRNMGTYDTKEEAEKRLKQVHYFKHLNESNNDYREKGLQIYYWLEDKGLNVNYSDWGETFYYSFSDEQDYNNAVILLNEYAPNSIIDTDSNRLEIRVDIPTAYKNIKDGVNNYSMGEELNEDVQKYYIIVSKNNDRLFKRIDSRFKSPEFLSRTDNKVNHTYAESIWTTKNKSTADAKLEAVKELLGNQVDTNTLEVREVTWKELNELVDDIQADIQVNINKRVEDNKIARKAQYEKDKVAKQELNKQREGKPYKNYIVYIPRTDGNEIRIKVSARDNKEAKTLGVKEAHSRGYDNYWHVPGDDDYLRFGSAYAILDESLNQSVNSNDDDDSITEMLIENDMVDYSGEDEWPNIEEYEYDYNEALDLLDSMDLSDDSYNYYRRLIDDLHYADETERNDLAYNSFNQILKDAYAAEQRYIEDRIRDEEDYYAYNDDELDEELMDETYSKDELDSFRNKVFNQRKIMSIYKKKKYGKKRLMCRTKCVNCGREKKLFLSNLVTNPEKYGSCICSDKNIESRFDTIHGLYKGTKKLRNNTSGYTGVSWVSTYAGEPYNKWRAYIDIDGQRSYLGDFSSKSKAIRARKAAAAKGIKWYNDNKNEFMATSRRHRKRNRKLKTKTATANN